MPTINQQSKISIFKRQIVEFLAKIGIDIWVEQDANRHGNFLFSSFTLSNVLKGAMRTYDGHRTLRQDLDG